MRGQVLRQELHSFVERQALYADEEVDGVAGEVSGRPSPEAFFDEEIVVGDDEEVVVEQGFKVKALSP